jgi:hypothetical protein
LARQLDWVHNVHPHLDHALYDHVVLLELGPSQLCTLDTPPTHVQSDELSPHPAHMQAVQPAARDGTTYHEPLSVSIYPTTFAPCFPDGRLNKPNSEGAEVCLDLERSMWCWLVHLFITWYHHCVHQSYEVFCGFCLEESIRNPFLRACQHTYHAAHRVKCLAQIEDTIHWYLANCRFQCIQSRTICRRD